MKTAFVTVLTLAGLALQTPACADDLLDPTRPTTFKPVPEQGGIAVPGPVSELKSIWMVGNRRYAIVGSNTVEVGSKVDDKRVTRITETQVTLRGQEGNETLSLVMGIEKKDRSAVPEPPPKRKRSTEN